MKLGVLTVPLAGMPLRDALKFLRSLGVEAVELGSGGVTNDAHCKAKELLKHPEQVRELKELLAENEMEISALSCHGNPVHPRRELAEKDHEAFVDTVELAGLLGVDTVVTFSGCPGDGTGAAHPNWVTCPWPPEYSQVLAYQWDEVLIPYWQRAAGIARQGGVKVAIEMHPGFCVYNPETMLRLRAAAGEEIGANFDPSHLFWQGIDAVAAIRELGDAIYYVHAKDCRLEMENVSRHGVIDTKHYGDELNRSWIFRTVGCGHGAQVWNDIVSTLRMVGYDGAISIEHEDSLMSVAEGLEKAVAFMQGVLIRQAPAQMWWA